ncbi:MAG TPA: NADH-quinone oxidoreductase subunit C [Acidimicrobiia bacterium]|jgi:NADH-quinone oxidoreductase subunit C|nr:NADH-quinone oxidoreductase subunit C [Acidimicrobiia bacterium]
MPDDEPREETHKEPEPPDDDIAAAVLARFDSAVFVRSHGQPVVYSECATWHDIAAFLRDEQEFTMCLDVTVVDHSASAERVSIEGVEPERFEVVANFISHPRNRRLRVIAEVPESATEIATLTDVYPGTDFAEREAYDLFGITFTGHPDLTRILMPDDWIGHPLRKDDAPARVPVKFKGDPGPS